MIRLPEGIAALANAVGYNWCQMVILNDKRRRIELTAPPESQEQKQAALDENQKLLDDRQKALHHAEHNLLEGLKNPTTATMQVLTTLTFHPVFHVQKCAYEEIGRRERKEK